ncbi:glycosyltransferase family 1 protein, partial [Synechococcus sp. Cruz CV12-2-Slac-r]|nr:glycosyltransferase family 1 protein [Synechococcus sp. Cruz CV12-2-Slac-r]
MPIEVNFYGHLSSVFGLAGGAKATLRSLKAAGLSVNSINMQLNTHEAFDCEQQLDSNPINNASIDIIHTNPNILKSVPNLLTVSE